MLPLPDALRQLAISQDGLLSRPQVLAAGLTRDAIAARLGSGRWQRMYPGVYAVFTGDRSRRAELWAAVLRAGPGAMLSYQSAAEVEGMGGVPGRPGGLVHVTVPAPRHLRAVPGLAIHRCGRAVQACHPTRMPPRTRIEETVLDLASSAASADEVFDWVCLACAGRLTTPARVRLAMAARPKLARRAEITDVLTEVVGGVHSGLELRYRRDVERPHDLPPAIRQARAVIGRRVQYRDILYREFGVAVETDGRAAHPASAGRRDTARDNDAAAQGLVTLRYAWADVTCRPCGVAAQVAAVLRQRGWRGSPRPCGARCPVAAVAILAG